MNQLYELREWLVSKIDGAIESYGEDSLISGFIAQIDALDDQVRSLTRPKTIAEWQAAKAPTPASKTQSKRFAAQAGMPLTDAAVVQMERLDGDIDEVVAATFARQLERENAELRTAKQMAEHERDSVVEELIALKSAPSATVAPDRPDWARQLPGAEIYDRAARGDHGYDRTASLSAGRYVCLCGGTCSHHDASQPSPTTKEQP